MCNDPYSLYNDNDLIFYLNIPGLYYMDNDYEHNQHLSELDDLTI